MKTNCNDCCTPIVINQDACGCCEGIDVVTPLPIYNRPGLSELTYRIGTHTGFLESMTARLTGYSFERKDEDGNVQKVYPLKGLTTRDGEDPSLAMLDAWATVADVLTFYQERIANEGYLRTATERRSVLELARLVGYKPRPGVSSSVFLAYTLDEKFEGETVLSAGNRAQSIPGPDELPQAFETSENLKARSQWNNLKPRMSRPQSKGTIVSSQRLYLKGLNTNLKLNDPLLIGVGDEEPELHWVKEIQPDAENDRTLILLEKKVFIKPIMYMTTLFGVLTLPPSIPPANSRKLKLDISEMFRTNTFSGGGSNFMRQFDAAEASHSILKTFIPQLANTLTPSLSNANVNATTNNKVRVFALRVKAAPFAHNAPKKPSKFDTKNQLMEFVEWPPVVPIRTR